MSAQTGPSGTTQTVPAIRSFQFDDRGIGAIKNSVNMFRGDVNLPLPLLSLPGRKGRDVEIQAIYLSNVHENVEHWNLEAPTGILGLGWDLPYDRIEVDRKGNSSFEDNEWFLSSGNNRDPMWRSDGAWHLFDLPGNFATGLAQGEVDDELRQAFARAGFALSRQVSVAGAEASWSLLDDGFERVYEIFVGAEAGELRVVDGGLGFELGSYKFWRIRYYPLYERWLVVTEDGVSKTYGGGVRREEGVPSATGHSVQWGVAWGDWYGASTVTAGQQRYPKAWNLAATFDDWGNTTSYVYQVVEQQVGEGGLAYTKACYPSLVTDTFGRTVSFEYGLKAYNAFKPQDPETAALPREYADPHKEVPNDLANAWQDRYETLYLEKAVVRDREGQEMYTLVFSYELRNFTANTMDDPLYGDTVKRVLTHVVQVNPYGESLPGLELAYYEDPADPNPGALRNVTYPQGGTATYIYEKKSLPICERSFPVSRPSSAPIDAWVPRVWFGPDYAVLIWFNTSSREMEITAYTWLGFWYPWSSDSTSFKAEVSLDSLNIITRDGFFAVHWQSDRADRTYTHLYHKVETSLGHWVAHDEEIVFPSLNVDFAAGDTFLIASDARDETFWRYTWDWRARLWKVESSPLQQSFCAGDVSSEREYFIGAQSNLYVVMCYDRGAESGRRKNRVDLYYRDALGDYHLGDSIAADDVNIAQAGGAENFYWSFGSSFVVATWVTATGTATYEYTVRIYSLDAEYRLSESFTRELKVDTGVQFLPSVVNDSFIGSGPNLLRYTGQDWEYQDLTTALPPSQSNVFWFAYGDDVAVATENGSSQVISRIGAFDPDVDSEGWSTEPRKFFDTTEPIDFRRLRFFPTAATDYVSWGDKIYYRGHASDWLKVPDTPIDVVGDVSRELIDTTTLQNQAPQFFAFLRVTDQSGSIEAVGTTVVNLANGRFGDVENFDEQYYRIYDDGRPRSALNGKIPSGPGNLMTWPLGEDLDRASSITLRRNLNGAVAGQVDAFPAVRLEIDNGFEKNSMVYVYDESTAACDPGGRVVKFYRSNRFVPPVEGRETDGPERPTGWTEFRYINGLPSSDPAGRYPAGLYAAKSPTASSDSDMSALDGFLLSQFDYNSSGDLVASKKSDWAVYTSVWATPDDKTEIRIRGSYALSSSESRTLDGVSNETRYSYNLATGQQTLIDLVNVNGDGDDETRRKATLYGCQVYSEMWAHNMLTQVAQDTNSVVSLDGEANEFAINASATRYRAWSHEVPDAGGTASVFDVADAYDWRGGETAVFTAWEADIEPGDAWWRRASVTVRSETTGVVLEDRDAMDRSVSYLWDVNDQYQVATFTNASLLGDEASYLGFESYEHDGGWTLEPAGVSWRTAVRDDRGHTGRRCLELNARSGRLERAFEPVRRAGVLLFSAWYSTPARGASPESGSAWTITIERDGAVLETLELPFEPTDGVWSYQSTGIDLSPHTGGGQLTVRTAASHSDEESVLLDDVRLSVLDGSFFATVFDSRFDLALAVLGPSLQTDRKVYDDFQRQFAAVGPTENVRRLDTQYLSRQGDDRFSTSFPNSVTSAQGTGTGFYSDFYRDGGWEEHWTTEEPGAWTVENGELVHNGGAESEIRLREPRITERYAAYILATPDGAPGRPLGLVIGDRLRISWDPTTGAWSLTETVPTTGTAANAGSRRQAPLRDQCTRGRGPHVRWLAEGYAPRLRRRAVPAAEQGTTGQVNAPMIQREWMVIVAGRVVQFYADGEQVIAYTAMEAVSGALGIFAADPVAFTDIVVSEGVQASVTYSDGAGNSRQVQALGELRVVVNATLYDEQGRGSVNTKPAFVAATSERQLLSYRPDFVSAFDWTSGLMTGLVSEYYSAGGGGFSDDQGTPYTRELYEDSPLGRIVEQGLPGKDFAALDLDTTSPAQRHTTKFEYSANDGDLPSELPPGQYQQTNTIDPDGNISARLTNKADEIVAQANLSGDTWVTTAYSYRFSTLGQTLVIRLPNAFAAPTRSTSKDWRIVTHKDPLGRVTRLEDPNTGTTDMVYDSAGQIRFRLSAEGRARGYYVYYRYDALDRLVENGTIEGDWDPVALREAADKAGQPPTPATWQSVSAYDGDGSDPLLVAQLESVITAIGDATGAASNVESYRYDARGHVLETTLRFEEEGGPAEAQSLGFTYDNLGNLVGISYPAVDRATPEVSYHFDELGWLRSIGAGDGDATAYALYEYNADGSVASASFAAGPGTEAGGVERSYSFNSPGWTTGSSDPVLRQEVFYTSSPDGAAGYYSGLPAGESVSFQGSLPEGAVSDYTYTYDFDALARIRAALSESQGQPRIEWSLGAEGGPVTYDANGNLLELTRGSEPLDYSYSPGTDKVATVDASGAVLSFGYDPDGRVTSSSAKGIEQIDYNRTLRLPQHVLLGDGTEVSYRYGGVERRVLKDSAGQRTVYLHGSYMRPLVERIDDERTARYVYGPGGLLAREEDGRGELVLPDRLGSSRAVLDGEGQVVAVFSYLPFGAFMNQAGQSGLRYLFTGQEFESDLGLYNFQARYYDTEIGRFYATDPQSQFASPYLYAGNNPILIIDPTGQFSWAAGLAIGGGSLAIVGGVALTVATGGAAAPAAVTVLGAVVGGALTSSGVSSVVYSSTHTNDWNVTDWAEIVAGSAASGAISGGFSVGAAAAGSAVATATVNAGLSGTTATAAGIAAGAALGAVGGVASQFAKNAILNPDDLTNGLLSSGLKGAASGVLEGYKGYNGRGGAKYALGAQREFSSFGKQLLDGVGSKAGVAGYGIASYYVPPGELLQLLGLSLQAGSPRLPSVPVGTSVFGTGPIPIPNSGGTQSLGGSQQGASISGASGSAQPRSQSVSQLRPKGFMMPLSQDLQTW